jgi:RimJ/RimL family protein N-acetyltransferase
MAGAPVVDVPLLTHRLVLGRFRPEDADVVASYRSEPAVARYQSWSPPVSEDAAAGLVAEFAAGEPGRAGWFQYAVTRLSDGVLLGDLGVCLHDNLHAGRRGLHCGD